MPEPKTIFPDSPQLILYDPLGELLGAGEGVYRYRFDDAVRLAGHACPTVAGAFVLAAVALKRLYGDAVPRRGEIRVTVAGTPDGGSTGPFTQVLTLITGAAGDNGFKGLAGRYVRQGLLRFEPARGDGPVRYTFTRCDNDETACFVYDPSPIPTDPNLGPDMQSVLSGDADPETRQRFRRAWRARVEAILADGGNRTVREV